MVKLNKIYTRTGDGGTAGLVDGSRVSQISARMAAIGEVDEANSADRRGALPRWYADGAHRNRLQVIQNELFDLGADIATPGDDRRRAADRPRPGRAARARRSTR